MFRETVTSADGSTTEGTCSEADAMRTLGRAVRLGYRVEATQNGGAVIVRLIHAGTDHWQPPRKHTVTLEPIAAAGKITATNRLDLGIIDQHRASRSLAARLDPATGRINAGLNSIPPAATARLMERGLVTVERDAVSVSLAARLAMLAQDHHTETREPRGYIRPSDMPGRAWDGHVGLNKGGGRGGKIYDRSSSVRCSCRGLSLPTEDRDDARRKAHEHRQEVTAAFVRDLGSEERAA